MDPNKASFLPSSLAGRQADCRPVLQPSSALLASWLAGWQAGHIHLCCEFTADSAPLHQPPTYTLIYDHTRSLQM